MYGNLRVFFFFGCRVASELYKELLEGEFTTENMFGMKGKKKKKKTEYGTFLYYKTGPIELQLVVTWKTLFLFFLSFKWRIG